MMKDKNTYMTREEQSKGEWSADCRRIISVLTPGTSITFSVVTPTRPSPQLTYPSCPQGLSNKVSSLGMNHKPKPG